MKMERTWIQDTLSVREERNIEIIRFAFGCKESWWRAFNSIFQCFFISLIQESTFIIWKLYKKPYESISTCTTRETEPSLPNIMRKLHLLWKFAFYLRLTLLSYSKSILSLFTHKSHDAAEHGHSSMMFGICSVHDLLLLLPSYHLLSNHITNFFTLGSNVSLILFKYSQKYEVFLHFDLRNCEDNISYFYEMNSLSSLFPS